MDFSDARAHSKYCLRLVDVPLQRLRWQTITGEKNFSLIVWMFDPCVMAFSHCKSLVQIDGTWLYGKYAQILLIVVEQDGK